MKASVISEMTTEEVADRLIEEKDQLSKLRMQHAISPLENPLLLRTQRKTIARLTAELTKRNKAEQAEK